MPIVKSGRKSNGPAIGYAEQPTGGYGNWAFQVNLLLQLGRLAGIPTIIPPYSEKGFPSPLGAPTGLIREPADTLTKLMVETMSKEDVISFIENVALSGRLVRLETGILGEPFNRFSTTDPIQFFRKKPRVWTHSGLRQMLGSIKNSPEQPLYVGLHFRGTDFRAWDSSALMEADYYLRALEDLRIRQPGRRLVIFGVTDDPESETIASLSSRGIEFLNPRGSASDHFSRLRAAEVVIASPSTFSFWSAMLGGKTIYFSDSWVRRKAKSSVFWENASQNSLRHVEVRLA